MDLEKLKVKRTIVRRLFTKAANEFDAVYKDEEKAKSELLSLLNGIEDKARRLFEVDTEVSNQLMLNADMDAAGLEDALTQELDVCETYRDKWVTLKSIKEELKASKVNQDIIHSNVGSGSPRPSLSQPNSVESKNLRLPRIEIKAFDGNIRNWISFWGQFRKIHEDESLEAEDKFHYLVQATVPGTPARELVESYPPSGDNYTKAVDLLKSRFARDELLIEVYVRDLLGIVLERSKEAQPLPLSSLYDQIVTKLHSLETLGVTSEKYAAMLFPLVESAIPDETLKAWERHRTQCRLAPGAEKTGTSQINFLTLLLDFLKVEVESEERLKLARGSFNTTIGTPEAFRPTQKKGKQKVCAFGQPTAATVLTSEAKTKQCLFCNKPHATTDCGTISGWSLEEKRTALKKSNGCFICLKPGHSSKSCKSYVKCINCKKRHHTLVCPDIGGEKVEVDVKSSQQSAGSTSERKVGDSNVLMSQQISLCYLQTLIVNIKSKTGYRPTRVLLDSGSQRSYMSKTCIKDLDLVSVGEETISHCLFGGVQVNHVRHNLYNVELRGIYESFSCKVHVLDQEKICNFIPHFDDQTIYKALRNQNIILTDVNNELDVELLLGADVLGKILSSENKPVHNGLTAVKTKLGWTIMGQNEKRVNPHNTFCCSNLNSLELPQLWKLDVLGIADPVEHKSKQSLEKETMDHFEKTVTQDETGRFTVQLPWIEGHPQILDNYDLAIKRLNSTTKRLVNIKRINDYAHVFQDWEKQNIIKPVENDKNFSRPSGHVIPHHPVIKESSLSTKVRPVFDASAKDKNGNSLNECLVKGPNLVELIPDILLKFRLGNIGVSADIAKAFLQIKVHKNDQEFLRFLWWKDNEQKEIQMFKHVRVVFGLKSSPFLLAAVIKYLLDNAPGDLTDTADKLKGSFYVDNCVTSVDTVNELDKFIDESKKLLSLGKFDLRDWAHSHNLSEDDTKPTPLLGLIWDRKNDSLSCNVKPVNLVSKPLTKRMLLSVAQSVFDPVGFTCPVTLIPKLLLQETWKLKVKWDDPLPKEIVRKFNQWLNQIHLLNDCSIPRKMSEVSLTNGVCTYHVFSDASKLAYSACVFLRVETKQNVSVQLLSAKSRISPCKEMTIPRLELLGAVIATRLFRNVANSLKLDGKVFFWTDSSVVLTWIKRRDDWNTFVANRCREIRENSDPENWNHIPGHENPADLPSRGCTIEQLRCGKWWEGPDWLKKREEEWPKTVFEVPEDDVNTEKKKCVTSASNSCKSDILQHFENISNYNKIVRTMGWIRRFIDNSRMVQKTSGELSTEELIKSENRVLKLVQDNSFQKEPDKSLKRLEVFKDKDGMLHIRSRLVMREDTEEFKYPILLPANDSIVKRLVNYHHVKNKHIGVQMLMNVLRENFWILGGRKTIKSVVSQCIKCKRHSVSPMEAPFAPLPKDRITHSMVFEVTGVDLAGPLILKTGEKAWIVLYTCAVYRSVHLELVKSLSTEAFLQSLRRFIARRGRPTIIYSDNGKNFVGTSNAFNKLDWNEIMRETSTEKIKWKFNPPTAAWWGGWWERLIGMLKCLLRRNLGRSSLHYEELYTVLCDLEAVLNSRPLTYVSSDSDDLIPLTPASFLQDLKTNEVADIDSIDKLSLVCRLKYIQKLREDLRARFRKEYLGLLVQRGKSKQMKINVGDVVLIGQENLKRISWPLAIVVKLFPGKDEVVRAVQLKTAMGEIIRPIQKLYPLEISSVEEPMPKPVDNPVKNIKTETHVEEKRNCMTKTRSGREIQVPTRLNL